MQDIESFTLLTATGDEITCSRAENPDGFALAIGGYGVFGVVTSLRIRLMRRRILRRVVALDTINRIPALVEQRIRDGFLYGDYRALCFPRTACGFHGPGAERSEATRGRSRLWGGALDRTRPRDVLPWARERMACVIFNLNVRHDTEGRAKAGADFRRLIDRALEQEGSYYLTYHRHAARSQVEAAHPRIAEWLAEKEKRDPEQVWRSDWYQHYRAMFAV